MTRLTTRKRLLVAAYFVAVVSASLLSGCSADPKKAEAMPTPPSGFQYQQLNSKGGASVAGTGKLKTLRSFRNK